MVKTYDKKKDLAVQLSKNFKVSEFDCKCSRSNCTIVLVDTALIDILQKIRDHFGASVNVNSGHRCEKHNAEVGGATGSHHVKGMAADIRVSGVDCAEVAKYAESIGVMRIGLYDKAHGDFVHIGSATTKNYWKNTSSNKVDTFGGKPTETVKNIEVTVPELKQGAKGDAVKNVQSLLISKGYKMTSTDGKTNYGADGSYGGATKRAVESFQKKNGLSVTGTMNEKTWEALLNK